MISQTLDQVGLCSWSGHPKSPQELVARLKAVGLTKIQLALDPLIRDAAWANTRQILKEGGIQVVSGMIETLREDYASPARIRETGGVGPDEAFRETLARVPRYVELLNEFGLRRVSFHAGFIPHDANDPQRAVILRRLGQIADAFDKAGKLLMLETGQETAETLVETLHDLARLNLRVNFDPGNMLLYSMGDPLKALDDLYPYIEQIHIKDAVASGNPEVWGVEKPAGEGQVNWAEFFKFLSANDYGGDLIIEREVGQDFDGEIKRAKAYLASVLE